MVLMMRGGSSTLVATSWIGGIDWERESGPSLDRILASLERRLLPGIREPERAPESGHALRPVLRLYRERRIDRTQKGVAVAPRGGDCERLERMAAAIRAGVVPGTADMQAA